MPGTTICLVVLGQERPGIVAAVTGVLFDTDCNIRDSQMTVLANLFAMILVVEIPTSMASAFLENALADVARRFELSVFIRRLEEPEVSYERPPGARSWALTIYGGDRRGIVHHVASVMARKGVSITEIKTRVITDVEGAGIVTMKLIAPPGVEKESVREQLADLATRFGVEVSLV
jgi:glycine cleavage system transcriptional repressor